MALAPNTVEDETPPVVNPAPANDPVVVDNAAIASAPVSQEAPEPVAKQEPPKPIANLREAVVEKKAEILTRPSIKELEQKDIEKQRNGKSADDVLDEIVASNKARRYGDTIITPTMITNARPERGRVEDKDTYLRFRSILGKFEGPKEGVVMPGVREEDIVGVADINELYHGYMPKWKRTAKTRLSVDEMMKNAGLPDDVRQIAVEEFTYGNLFEEYYRRLREAGRGLAVALPNIIKDNTTAAVKSMWAAGTTNIFSPAFKSEYASREAEIREGHEAWKSKARGLFGLVGFNIEAAANFNEIIHETLEDKFKESDPDKYESLAFEKDEKGTFLLDPDGNKIQRKFVAPDQANYILDAGFETLSYPERATAIVGEEATMMVLTGGGYTAARGSRLLNKALKLKENPKFAPMLKGIDDPEDIVKAASHILKFDETNKFFKAGLLQYRTNESRELLNNQIDVAQKRMAALKAKRNKTTVEEKELASLPNVIKQYKNTRSNARVRGRYYPYIKDSIENAAVIGGGAFLFREHGFFFEDENTREFAGLMAMSLGGYRIAGGLGMVVGATAKTGAKSVASSTVPGIFQMTSEMIGMIPVVGPVVVDQTVKNIQAVMGRSLGPGELRNLEVIVGTFARLDPRMRREAMESMGQTRKLYDRIVNAFPEGAEREAAREAFLTSYANSTGLLTLAASDALNKSEVNMVGIMGVQISDMENNLRESTNLIRATDMSLNRFMEMTQNIKNADSRKMVEEWVQARKAGLGNLSRALRDKNTTELKSLDAVEDYVISTGQLRPGDLSMRQNFVSLRKEYLESLGQTVNEAEVIKALDEKINKSIDEAIDAAKAARGTGTHKASNNKVLEMFLDETTALAYRDGQKPYKELDVFAEGRNIDTSPVFEDLMAQDDFKGIIRYFGPESEIFDSKVGKLALKSFEDMMYRTIPKDRMQEMRSEFTKRHLESKGAEGIDATNMTDHELFLEVLKTDRANALETGREVTFKPFTVGNAYELELMNRAFKKAGQNYEDAGDSNLARIFNGFASRMDNTLERQDPQYFEKLEDARQAWRRSVGEAMEDGMPLGDFAKSRQRMLSIAERGTKMGVFGTAALYKKGQEPVELISDLSKGISDFMSPGSKKDIVLLQTTMERLTSSLGRVMPNGSRGFDLTNPTEARRFNQLKAIVQEIVMEQTGDRVLGVAKKKRAVAGARLTSLDGFDGGTIGEMDQITSNLLIPVIRTEGGPVEYEALIDVADMYGATTDLQKAVTDSKANREAFINLKKEFKTAKADAKSDINKALQDSEDQLKLWEENVSQLSSKDFFENFILSGEGGGLEILKRDAIKVYKAAGYSDEAAEAAFKNVAMKYTITGMFEAAGVGPVKGKVPGAEAGREAPVRDTASPEQLLELMTSDGVREQLEKILEPEHLDFIEDIVRYTNESTMTVKVQQPSGVFSGLTMSSKISRLWSLARGVVSPAYIATDYAFNAAKAGQIDIFKLALQDKNAAEVMVSFFQPMELITPAKIKRFNNAVKTFAFTELARQGEDLSLIYIDEEDTKEDVRLKDDVMSMQTDKTIYDNPTVFDEEQDNDETNTQGQ